MTQSTEGALPPTSGPVPRAGAGARPGRGVIPLRPLLAGEILDGAATVMRSFPGTVFGLTAVVVVLGQAVSLPLDYLYLRFVAGLADNGSSFDVSALSLVTPATLVGQLGQCLLLGLLATTVSRAVLGRTAAPGEVWDLARPKLPRLVGMTLLMYLVLAGVLAAALAPGVIMVSLGQAGGSFLLFLGVLGGGYFFIWRAVSWSLAGAALMLEDQPARAALRRSAVLVKGAWWRVVGVRLAAQLVAVMVTLVLTVVELKVSGSRTSPDVVHADGTVSGHLVTWTALLISTAFATAIQVLVTPFTVSVTALQFMDQRMRREALDIQLTRRGVADAAPDGGGARA